MCFFSTSSFCPAFSFASQLQHKIFPPAGSHWYSHDFTTSTSGSKWASARTAVDFAVPFCPLIKTPPIEGFMALRINSFLHFFLPNDGGKRIIKTMCMTHYISRKVG